MKQLTFLLLLSVILLSGCSKEDGGEKIWDITPVVASISVVDAQGNDLLNPQTPNALDVKKIKAVYKDQDYVCDAPAPKAGTKAYMPYLYGLKSGNKYNSEVFLLRFGELEGAKSYSNESLTIVWEDGSSDKISFNRNFEWESNGDPSVEQEWFLNDASVTGDCIKIVK